MSYLRNTKAWLTSAQILAVCGLAIAVHAIDTDRQSLVLGGLRNAGHIPLFMVLTGIVWRITHSDLLKTVMWVSLIALLAEVSQRLTGGETDWRDLLADAGGLVLALIAIVLARTPVVLNRLAAGLCVAVGLLPAAYGTLVWQQREAIMPCLADFQNPLLTNIQVPFDAEWINADPDRASLRLREASYAGIRLLDPIADWSQFDALIIGIETDPPVPVTIRIHDTAHTHEHADRFNRTFTNGAFRAAIALSEIRTGPADRSLNLTQIEELTLFVRDPPPGTVLALTPPCLH